MSKENEEPKIETNWQPSAEFRFFIYDPEGEPFTYFKSAADRDNAAADIISNYMDDGWAEEVEHVVAGELTHVCQQTNVRKRPDDEELDEEGCDGEGTYWGEFDTFCNYELVPLQTKKAEQLVTPGGGAPGDHDGTKAAALVAVKRMLRQAIGIPASAGICEPIEGFFARPQDLAPAMRAMRYVKFIDYEDLAAENERLLKAGQTLQADYSSYRREVEHKQGYYDALAARVAELERDAAVAGDLAALVVRLARALRKAAPDNDLAAKALDYLQRKGLQGSPLRDSQPQPEGIDSEGGSCD